jgi:hypothetical protein
MIANRNIAITKNAIANVTSASTIGIITTITIGMTTRTNTIADTWAKGIGIIVRLRGKGAGSNGITGDGVTHKMSITNRDNR